MYVKKLKILILGIGTEVKPINPVEFGSFDTHFLSELPSFFKQTSLLYRNGDITDELIKAIRHIIKKPFCDNQRLQRIYRLHKCFISSPSGCLNVEIHEIFKTFNKILTLLEKRNLFSLKNFDNLLTYLENDYKFLRYLESDNYLDLMLILLVQPSFSNQNRLDELHQISHLAGQVLSGVLQFYRSKFPESDFDDDIDIIKSIKTNSSLNTDYLTQNAYETLLLDPVHAEETARIFEHYQSLLTKDTINISKNDDQEFYKLRTTLEYSDSAFSNYFHGKLYLGEIEQSQGEINIQYAVDHFERIGKNTPWYKKAKEQLRNIRFQQNCDHWKRLVSLINHYQVIAPKNQHGMFFGKSPRPFRELNRLIDGMKSGKISPQDGVKDIIFIAKTLGYQHPILLAAYKLDGVINQGHENRVLIGC